MSDAVVWSDEMHARCHQWRPIDHARNRGVLTATRLVTALGYGYGPPGDAIGWDSDIEPSWPMRRGTALEPAVLEWIWQESDGMPGPLKAIRRWVVPDIGFGGCGDEYMCHSSGLGTIVHASIPWAAASPDALVILADGRRCVVEVKARARADRYTSATGEETISEAERIQILWQILCTGADCGWLAADTPYGLIFRPVEPTAQDRARLLADAGKVWQAIGEGDPLGLLAVVSETAARSALVRDAYADPDRVVQDESWPDGLDVAEASVQLASLREEQRLTADAIQHIETTIQAALGGQIRAECDDWRVTWPLIRPRPGCDAARLRAEYPEAAEACSVERATHRGRLTITRRRSR